MDVRQLRYVVRLAETLHFGRAAAKEHIAQSTFSEQIARLERELGTRLFERGPHRVTPTPAGTAFAERARQILDGLADAAAEARVLAAAGPQVLRIGMFPDSAGELSPLIFAGYRRAFPEATLRFVELSMVDQVEAVTAGDVDVALLRLPQRDSRLDLQALFAEPRYAGLPDGHPLSRAPSLSVGDLLDEPFATAAPGSPRTWAGYWCFDDYRGHPGRVAASVRSVSESLWAIAYQGAVDSVPGSAARLLYAPGVSFVRLRDAAYSTVALATRRGERRAHVLALRPLARRIAGEHLDMVPGARPATEDALG